MPIADFFQGLLGGLAGGVAEQGATKRKQELLVELENMRVASDLLKSGNYEAFSLLDAKHQKSLGFEKEDPRLQALVGFQRKSRETEQKTQESKLVTSGLQQQTAQLQSKTAELGLVEEETKQQALAGLKGDDRVAAMFPGVINAKIAQENSRIRVQELGEARQERTARLQQQHQEFTVKMEEIKESRGSREQIAAETASLKQQQITTTKELKEESIKTRKLSIALGEVQKADEQRSKIYQSAPKQSKVGKNSYPSFKDAGEAKAWVVRANQAELRYAEAQKRVAGLEEGFTPDEPISWTYHSDSTGLFGLGAGTHVAVPQSPSIEGQQAQSTAQSPLDRMIEKAQPSKAQPTAPVVVQKPTTKPISRDITASARDDVVEYNTQARERGGPDLEIKPEEFGVFRELRQRGMSTMQAAQEIIAARKKGKTSVNVR